MKVLTLNCHAWQEENQMEKIKHLAQVIKEKQYDVIALQEVMQLIDETTEEKVKQDNYAVVLLSELMKLGVYDYQFIWDLAHIGFDVYEEGLAILTKGEIKSAKSFLVTKSQDIQHFRTRRIVGLEIMHENQPITFYSCHLGWYHDEEEPFKGQVDELVAHLDSDQLNIIMGDFNNDANVRGEGYDYILSKGLIDTYTLAKTKDEGSTVVGKIDGWSENKRDLRIDLVLTNQPVTVKSSNVIFNGKNKDIVSDHYGVEVEFDLHS
ncbi:endonuclease/exonuclease/phosphatase family protein [Turicibacter sp. TJ11]|uniref:endonuclease/exonuclease/phosphatase family protein n=1 Tax=Turicibacter sp. TJ11 TaxID=2806443 RepID=UPI001F370D76|nr:endonuclease/exonuclease/phosphatase family protein [Turicibacter sp. TJ11]